MEGYRYEQYQESADWLRQHIGAVPQTAMILGSGLSFMADRLEEKVVIPYADIPHFPQATVKTHAGQMVYGLLEGKPVLMMNGRYHYYEGHTMQSVTYPVRVMKLLGVQHLIITNAAGGINWDFSGGTVMLITDHIKLMGDSPLRGINLEEFGVRFPDMTYAYTPRLRELAQQVAQEEGIDVQQGVYGYAYGPQYETPAEVRALGILGADAVGMSTAPEVIAAAHCGMEVLGVSCITNMAAGITGEKLDDEEVNRIAKANAGKLSRLLLGVVRKL